MALVVRALNPKYLIFFSYLGSRYSGVQRQTARLNRERVDWSIQIQLENALAAISPKPLNPAVIALSSRTDAGVHCLRSSGQTHLEHPMHPFAKYSGEHITSDMNQWLVANHHDIIVRETHLVPQVCNARKSVLNREYVYLVAFMAKVIRRDKFYSSMLSNEYREVLSVLDLSRVATIQIPQEVSLDLVAMRRAVDELTGSHNYAAFEATTRERVRSSNVTIDSFTIKPINLRTGSHFDKYYDDLDVYEFRVRARSFLYKQIRRMVGTVINVGLSKMTLEDLIVMRDSGSSDQWTGDSFTAPSDGLYLSNINYDLQECPLCDQ